MRRAPAKPVRACFVQAVVVQCCCPRWPARPRCNATASEDFPHTSRCTLHTSNWTLHHISDHVSSSHLILPHLSSSHLIPSPLTCHLRKFFSTVFISSEHWSTFLISSNLFSTHLSCSSCSARQKALTVSTQKLETQMHAWGCSTLYGTFAILPSLSWNFLDTWLSLQGGAQVTL